MAMKEVTKRYSFKNGIDVIKHLFVPHQAGNPAGVADFEIFIDETPGKLGFRVGGVTQLVPLDAEVGAAGLTQENAEDVVQAMFTGADMAAGDITWAYTDNGAGAGTIKGTIKNDSVAYAKLQNVSTAARVLGLPVGAAAPKDVEELTGAQLRAILDVLDADTLNGSTAAAIAANAVNTILNGAGAAYDTLVEVGVLLAADDTADALIVAAMAVRSRFGYITVPDGATPQNIVHGFGLANIHAWSGEIIKTADGTRPEYDLVASDGNTIVITDDTGTAIPAGLKFFGTFGV